MRKSSAGDGKPATILAPISGSKTGEAMASGSGRVQLTRSRPILGSKRHGAANQRQWSLAGVNHPATVLPVDAHLLALLTGEVLVHLQGQRCRTTPRIAVAVLHMRGCIDRAQQRAAGPREVIQGAPRRMRNRIRPGCGYLRHARGRMRWSNASRARPPRGR